MANHRYFVYDRIKRTIIMEFDAEDGKEATKYFDISGYKESTHFLFTCVNTKQSRMTKEEADLAISMGD